MGHLENLRGIGLDLFSGIVRFISGLKLGGSVERTKTWKKIRGLVNFGTLV